MSSYPAIPEPNLEPQGLLTSVQALKQAVEMLTGQRNGVGQALTSDDQPDLGALAGRNTIGATQIDDGSIITIKYADGSVTYAKIQNVSATARILGRKTAGAGVIEECTLSQILDFIGSAAQGDILYRGSAGWARLAAGTSGNFLKTLGAGADPAWGTVSTGGLTLITTSTAPAGTTWTITGLGGYKALWVSLRNFGQSSGSSKVLQLEMSGNGGSTWGAVKQPFGATSLITGGKYIANFQITRTDQTNNQMVFIGSFLRADSGGTATNDQIDVSSRGPIDAFRLTWGGGGSFDAGEADVYGWK